MDRTFLVFFFLFVAGMSFSCKKIPAPQNPGDAQWIKVISDSDAHFTGKIRVDSQNNLYCSYNYSEEEISGPSAIVKLDSHGNIEWRHFFDSLSIFDFTINQPDQSIIIASATDEVVTLTRLSFLNDDLGILGSYTLPTSGKSVRGMKILLTEDGYLLSGTMSLNPKFNGGFIIKMSSGGDGLWKRAYIFGPSSDVSTSITGCAQTNNSFILVGSLQYSEPFISQFFVMKCDGSGEILRAQFYNTSTYDTEYHGYYCATSDIVAGGDSFFYASAFNVLYNTIGAIEIDTKEDKSARIFQINSECEILDTLNVNLGLQNQVADLVKKKGGGLFIGLNPNPLANFAIIGQRNSFIANVSSAFTLENISYIQTQYSDYLGSVCAMPDGHYAIETMIQSFGQGNYKLQVIKTDENGNF